jgi:hypothetical protein
MLALTGDGRRSQRHGPAPWDDRTTERLSAAGLSASVITRLTAQWQAEREALQRRDLSEVGHGTVRSIDDQRQRR